MYDKWVGPQGTDSCIIIVMVVREILRTESDNVHRISNICSETWTVTRGNCLLLPPFWLWLIDNQSQYLSLFRHMIPNSNVSDREESDLSSLPFSLCIVWTYSLLCICLAWSPRLFAYVSYEAPNISFVFRLNPKSFCLYLIWPKPSGLCLVWTWSLFAHV